MLNPNSARGLEIFACITLRGTPVLINSCKTHMGLK